MLINKSFSGLYFSWYCAAANFFSLFCAASQKSLRITALGGRLYFHRFDWNGFSRDYQISQKQNIPYCIAREFLWNNLHWPYLIWLPDWSPLTKRTFHSGHITTRAISYRETKILERQEEYRYTKPNYSQTSITIHHPQSQMSWW
jgi:hypothetical protein